MLDLTDEAWTETPLWDDVNRRVSLYAANLQGANFWFAKLQGIILERVNLQGANLEGASFQDAYLWSTDLQGANLSRANLSGADLWGATITNADFTNALLQNTNMRNVLYNPRRLKGKCTDLRGADAIGGNAILRRRMMDRDYIDSHYSRRAGTTNRRILPELRIRLSMGVWHLFAYGGSWPRVAAFGALCVILLGFAYQWAVAAGHLTYLPNVGSEELVRPWFVAMMGFSTLGLSDLVAPATVLGSALMALNVLLGFITLGLLLSVLGNVFARRAD